jgi:iron complex outermembrane receptor protein
MYRSSAETRKTSALATTSLVSLTIVCAASFARASVPEPTPGAHARQTEEAVLVTAKKRAKAVRGSALGSRTILETPFSISQVTAAQIKTLGATTINDAFSYDSSVKLANSGVASGNTFRVRGLTLDRTNGFKVDGLPFPYWFQDFPLDSFESVELLKGLGGFLYGFAAPGGILDFESKQPTPTWIYEADTGVRSGSIVKEHVDFGGPLDASGDTGLRVNLAQEAGLLYNRAYNEDYSGSVALTGKITPEITWSLNAFYLNTIQLDQVNSISLLPTEGAVTHLPVVNGKLDVGSPGTRKYNSNPVVTPSVTWQISPQWKATLTYRYSNLDEQFPGNTIEVLNNKGDYANIAFNMNRYFEYNFGQAQLEGNIDTGPLHHQIVVGAATDNVIFDLFNPTPPVTGIFNLYSGSPPTPLGNDPGAYNYDHQKIQYERYQTIWQNALFLSDTITWGPWSLLGGFRYNDYAERDLAAVYSPPVKVDGVYQHAVFNEAETEKQIISYNLHPVTPSAALTYSLSSSTKAYFSYTQALQSSIQAPSTGVSNANAFLPPATSSQYEVGLKSAWDRLSGTLALFRIEEPAGLYGPVLPGEKLPVYTLTGEAQIQGIEINPVVRVTDNLTLTSSLSLLDGTYTRATAYLEGKSESAVGKVLPGVSPVEANAFAAWKVPSAPGLTLTGGVRYLSHSYTDTLNLTRFAGATIFDVGASYTLPVYGKKLVLRGNIQNLTDRGYWVTSQNQISAAPPRTFWLNAEVDF